MKWKKKQEIENEKRRDLESRNKEKRKMMRKGIGESKNEGC